MTEEEWEELLAEVRNYLDITFEDEETNRKLSGIIRRGIAYLDARAGTPLDYQAEGLPRQLLFDYCRYARNNAAEQFGQNFRGELIALRLQKEVEDYDRENGGA